jgi:hypothetical protein
VSSGDLSITEKGNTLLFDCSVSLTQDGKIKGTDLFYERDSLGVGRKPLNNYKFDIAVPKNTLITAFHIGDGSAGFSMGNGTNNGFIPQIIGMGCDENDCGLYFIGRAGNNLSSETPLVVVDGRDLNDRSLTNRPIFGVSSGSYDDYKFLINHNGNFFSSGSAYVKDVQFNDDDEIGSLKETIKNLLKRVKELEDTLTNS